MITPQTRGSIVYILVTFLALLAACTVVTSSDIICNYISIHFFESSMYLGTLCPLFLVSERQKLDPVAIEVVSQKGGKMESYRLSNPSWYSKIVYTCTCGDIYDFQSNFFDGSSLCSIC